VPVVAIRRLLSAEGAGADSIGRRKFCMLKCRIDTACREPASAHPIPPRRSTCFRERDLHNSKEIIFRAARLAGSSRSRSEKFDDLCENSRASFPEHQTALRGGATYSPGESRRRVLVKRSASGWGEWGGREEWYTVARTRAFRKRTAARGISMRRAARALCHRAPAIPHGIA